MSKLTEYIEDLKKQIEENNVKDKREILRRIYISLGKKMDFDLNYTFGNSKARSKIFNKHIDEEELNHILETHKGICKSFAYLVERIAKEFDIDIKTVREEDLYLGKQGRHTYNEVKIDGETYILDLEDDLEFIQSGAKTKIFGINVDKAKPSMVSSKELRDIDMKIGYIPEGYYLEDIIWMLKKAVDIEGVSLEEKLEIILQNLNVYRDTSNIEYREMIRYHSRVLNECLKQNELHKIHQIDCYKTNEDTTKSYTNCIVVDMKNQNEKVYIYSKKDNQYKQISMNKLIGLIDKGLTPMQGVPGLRRTMKKMKEGQDR